MDNFVNLSQEKTNFINHLQKIIVNICQSVAEKKITFVSLSQKSVNFVYYYQKENHKFCEIHTEKIKNFINLLMEIIVNFINWSQKKINLVNWSLIKIVNFFSHMQKKSHGFYQFVIEKNLKFHQLTVV